MSKGDYLSVSITLSKVFQQNIPCVKSCVKNMNKYGYKRLQVTTKHIEIIGKACKCIGSFPFSHAGNGFQQKYPFVLSDDFLL